MANVRVPLTAINVYDSFPLGKDKCVIVDAIADGTCLVGHACKMDTTNPNKAVLATVGAEAGVVCTSDGLELGDTPTAGTNIKVCLHGPCVAKVNAGADNKVAGTLMLCAHATEGHFIPAVGTAGSATSSSANLLDWRASDDENYHIIMFKGLSLNNNTHA